ncbi:hypothetical protein CONLIGDRAFT_634815 [Coniochaeta ligniaria NRRL 30616]|uniref:THUMP domain-containing protein n=1 Tax=Coniochaeta ligniaria NRRL 30616 TaxID=1408157 RepID=A0A1J7JBF0_9PEZI|nr:hypothetical protein CONLIGDRAFT_634815 [Coniochaeta ligniaria NRRL 30616]
MPSSTKRKEAPTGNSGGQGKRNKRGGNDNKWKTSHQQTKEGLLEGIVSPGEMGIWVSCARSQEGKAAREVVAMFEEYAEILYGVKQPGEEDAANDDEEEDIEASVKRELDAMKATGKEAKAAGRIFTPVKMNVACLLFVRTRSPIEPVEFVKRICQDAKSGEQRTRSRYVNRLVPMTAVGKATEPGLLELARKVLGDVFDLSGKRAGDDATTGAKQEKVDTTETGSSEAKNADDAEVKSDGPEAHRPCSFAIRPSIRNNNTLKRDVIINQVAGLINNQQHKVDLEKPDKVILVEVYQNAVGMSIVDGDYWNELKKYNLTELYSQANNQGQEEGKPSAQADNEH